MIEPSGVVKRRFARTIDHFAQPSSMARLCSRFVTFLAAAFLHLLILHGG
jgi:hypothetical protein